LFKKLNRKY